MTPNSLSPSDDLSAVFAALADPQRRRILAALCDQPMPVGALVDRLAPLSQPGVTRHLGVLERAGLIRREAQGRQRICQLEHMGFAAVDGWLAEHRAFWAGALDRLAAMAERGQPNHPDAPEGAPDD
ncbi:MAG: metalloregulator ArsR/SmtB family transcription factor [Pseudomonadota bacterium]